MTNINKDDLILKLLEKVKSKKEEIESATNPVWKTNCTLTIDNKIINLKTLNSVEKILEVYTKIVAVNNGFSEAKEILGVDLVFKFQGYSMEEWTNDFVNAKRIIGLRLMKEELAKDEKTLDSLLSKEKREELELKLLASKYSL